MKKIPNIQKTKIIEQVTTILKNHILKGKYKNGDFLPPEMELCNQLGIGRSTLREAIKTLESQGFVTKNHGVGIKVVDESLRATSDMLKILLSRKGSNMYDLIDVRYVNEIRTAELAALNATPENLDEIEKHLMIMRNSLVSNNEYLQADIEFHLAIAKASQNKIFVLILKIIRPLIEDMILKTLEYDHRPEQSLNFHENIFKAIKEKNPDLCASAMKQHLKGTKSMLGIVDV
jgi:GntR family transcriptional regulator, transcriptional repressor for pyruvate dehydrogenase complex